MDLIRQHVENKVYGKNYQTETNYEDYALNNTDPCIEPNRTSTNTDSPTVQDPFAAVFIVLFAIIYVSFVFVLFKDLLADISDEEDDEDDDDTPSQPAAADLQSEVFIPLAIESSNHSVAIPRNLDFLLDDIDSPSQYPLISYEDLGFLYNNSKFYRVEQKEKIARDAVDNIIFVEINNKNDIDPKFPPMEKEKVKHKHDTNSKKSLNVKIKRPINTNRMIDSINKDLQRRAKERATRYSVEELKKMREEAKKRYDKNVMRAKVKEMAKEF